eukprot:5026901-Karenia_brevis.AAC.1
MIHKPVSWRTLKMMTLAMSAMVQKDAGMMKWRILTMTSLKIISRHFWIVTQVTRRVPAR